MVSLSSSRVDWSRVPSDIGSGSSKLVPSSTFPFVKGTECQGDHLLNHRMRESGKWRASVG